MTDSPQMAAYRTAPVTYDGISILRNGGVWEARDPLPPLDGFVGDAPAIDSTYQVHHYKARPRGRFGAVWHEVYSVETGEVVGRIN